MDANTKPTVRVRANFSVTTKGVYTPDVTVEISDIDITSDALENALTLVEGTLSELHDKVVDVAESKGYTSCCVVQEK